MAELKKCTTCYMAEHGACTVKRVCRYCKKVGHTLPMCELFLEKKFKQQHPKGSEGTFSETFLCNLTMKGCSTTVRGLFDNGSDTSKCR